ncbi:ADP-forming succinate--CoA ligase subunit beta [Clostridiaceae bacterium M8S5]|nr:ADP-forming succinate--CoA ligase subunit beta [Clostridiaceae bacterium M8S5]
MNIHEYQAKQILKQYGIKVMKGYLITKEEDIKPNVQKIESDIAVVKAQVHAGGRSKAGGVKLVTSLAEAIETSKDLLGKTLVTHQTGSEGVLVRKLYIEEGCNIKKEYYLSIVLDRSNSQVAVIASEEGGVEIEEVAKKTPEKIIKTDVNSCIGLTDYQIRYIINKLKLPLEAHKAMEKTLKGLYKCYIENDCSLVEINPLVLTLDNDIVALDSKINFDDNALFRHPDIKDLRDIKEENPKEIEASEYGLSYIALNGSIGCLVNGAGLAMATMDSIKNAGGSPANFLDVGGSASSESVTNAFVLILSDPQVRGIFVNIFGGIMKCDVIANGIIKATNIIHTKMPIVVRLEGTNEEKGKEILKKSNANIHIANSLDEGSEMIVKLLNKINYENHKKYDTYE